MIDPDKPFNHEPIPESVITEPLPISRWGKALPTSPPPPRWRADVPLLLVAILLIGAYLRFLNVDWDEGQHLHPDERYLTMVAGAVSTPDGLGEYLNSYESPLNPFNQGHSNYAYGTLPLFLTRYLGEWLNQGCLGPSETPGGPERSPARLQSWVAQRLFGPSVKDCVQGEFTGYGKVHLLGRMLAAAADLGVMVVLFLIGRRLYGEWVGLLATGLYALTVLPIQQAHFFTVDPYANLFIVVSLYFSVRGVQRGGWFSFGVAGLSFGLALACKVSVWPFVGVIILAAAGLYLRGCEREDRRAALDNLMFLLVGLGFVLIAITAALGLYSAVKLTLYLAIAVLLGGGLVLGLRRLPVRPGQVSVDGALARLVLAGLLAFIAFRLAQPYAFAGPGFDVERWQGPEYDWFRPHVPDSWYKLHDLLPEPLRALILPDPRFVGALGSVNGQLTGEADVPWGHQWANRTPFLFPWVNMVVWGMGIPLGLAAWTGWLLAARDLWRGQRRLAHLLPWVWVLFFFFYQGTQWVKSIRYILQIYPALILLAAWWMVRVWNMRGERAEGRGESTRPRRNFTPHVLCFIVLLIMLGTLLWGWGFSRIYAQPNTRLTASRWMRDNLPTAATLHYQVDGQPRQHFVNMGGSFTYASDEIFQVHKLTLPLEEGATEAQVTGVTFTHLGDPQNDPEPETFRVELAYDTGREQVVAESEQTLHLEQAMHSLGDAHTFHFESASLQLGQDYYLFTQATAGVPVNLDTTVIANEHYDDSLPYPVDGFNPFGGAYRGLHSSDDGKLGLYNNDNVSKRQQIYAWLDEADVIAMSSNRLHGSIPRIPSRFPLTIEYYRALFAEELGFDLIASFTSFIRVGPFQFPDQEIPFPPDEPTLVEDQAASVSIYLPPAEEAFSVYDHQQVFLFRKAADYSRAKVEAVLEGVDLSQIVWMTAREATEVPNAIMLTDEEWDRQRAGGTWSGIFDSGDSINRSPLAAVIVWWLLLQALGLFALPLLFLATPGLADRGYPFAKTLGLLVWAVLAWWAGSSGGRLTYSREVIFACLLLLVLVAGALAWWQRRQLWTWVRREWRAILVGELLFNLLFLVFLAIRYANPDVWHPYMGGERPMELAYLSAIVKSTSFPPYDPWFAGGSLNYYYFGWVIVATPIKLLGLLPEIAFNLALPTFFGLTGAAAYSLAYNLAARRQRREPGPRDTEPPNPDPLDPELPDPESLAAESVQGAQPATHNATLPLIAGLVAAVFVVVLGNLAEIRLVVNTLYKLGSQNLHFESTIPGLRELVAVGRGVWQAVIEGKSMPWASNWPYWNASRAIPYSSGEAAPITEFPFFSFLYGDLHPHLMAMPLTLLVLAIGSSWVSDSDFWWAWRVRQSGLYRRRWLSTVWSLALGALVVGALRPANTWDYATYLITAALLLILGHLVQRDAGWSWSAVRDRLVAAGGRFSLLAGLSYLFFLPYINRYALPYRSAELWKGSKTPILAYLAVHGLFLFPIVTWLVLKVWRWARGRVTSGLRGWVVLAALVMLLVDVLVLLKGYPVAIIVLPVEVLALLVLLEAESRPTERFVALLVFVSLALTLLVEVIVLKGDISRMNTVFKFYLQVWLMLGVSAATCLIWLLRGEPTRSQSTNLPNQPDKLARKLWLSVMLLLVFLASLYPLFATWAKVRDRYVRQVGAGLDGLAWMTQATTTQGHVEEYGQRIYPLSWDYQALMWLRENVQGSPVVVEGVSGPTYRSLRSRVASYTGLPIILGYDWHQRQQRAALKTDLIGQRMRDVNDLFDTHDPQHARILLDRYDVELIYLGELERAYHDPLGLAKFDQMVERGWLTRIYQNEGVTIYQVMR